jgi:hypothetical protein
MPRWGIRSGKSMARFQNSLKPKNHSVRNTHSGTKRSRPNSPSKSNNQNNNTRRSANAAKSNHSNNSNAELKRLSSEMQNRMLKHARTKFESIKNDLHAKGVPKNKINGLAKKSLFE